MQFSKEHLSYSADNFLLQIRPNGDSFFATCDNSGQCSPVDVEDCPL